MGGIATRWFSIGKKGRNWMRRIDNAHHHHHRQESIRSLSHLLPSLPSLLFCSRSTVILQPPDRDVAVTSLFSPRNILRPPTLTPLPTIVRSSQPVLREGACSEIRSIVSPDFSYRHLLRLSSVPWILARNQIAPLFPPTLAVFL